MSKISIAIIGAGSRGLSLLERIVTLYPEYSPNQRMEIWLIDKNEAGFGVHLPNQPDYFLTNTVACQITLFGDDSVTAAGSIREGPNLYQWARDQGYKKSGQLYSRRPQGGRDFA
ncbi:FAD/NAD(P)-binding protein [Erwinia aphidicola]|nr:FAD/NAD(P)-binding protein [Erwinia aphidicola]